MLEKRKKRRIITFRLDSEEDTALEKLLTVLPFDNKSELLRWWLSKLFEYAEKEEDLPPEVKEVILLNKQKKLIEKAKILRFQAYVKMDAEGWIRRAKLILNKNKYVKNVRDKSYEILNRLTEEELREYINIQHEILKVYEELQKIRQEIKERREK